MTIDINVVIGVIGFAVAVASFFIGRQLSAKTDGVRDGRLDEKLDNLKTAIEEIKSELKDANLSALKVMVEELKKRIDRHEESISRIHKRIDDLSK